VQEQKLLPADGYALDQYGNAVAIDGEVIAVGSFEDDDGGTGAGSVYMYRFDGSEWDFEQKLGASDAWTQDHFGVSVSVSGDTLVVGAHGNDDDGTDSGAAYSFLYNGYEWIEQVKLLSPDGDANDNFGQCVSASGAVIVVGAQFDDSPETDAGSACLFMMNDGGAGAMPDCNDNGTPDICDIASGESSDGNGNGIPDECEDTPDPDVNGDGVVNVMDLLELIVAWGICNGECPEDINDDGFVDVLDLVALIDSWDESL
jgi:hypothetical protein